MNINEIIIYPPSVKINPKNQIKHPKINFTSKKILIAKTPIDNVKKNIVINIKFLTFK